MSRINVTSYAPQEPASSVVREDTIEYGFIGTLHRLKYQHRPDITDRATLEKNFREKFESLNRDRHTDSEFARLLDERFLPVYESADEENRKITRLYAFAAELATMNKAA